MSVPNSQFRLLQDGGNQTISPVVEYGCFGEPGFVYIMGCVVEGFDGKKQGYAAKPEFDECVQLTGICGPTCDSGSWEPAYYDHLLNGGAGFNQSQNLHCVNTTNKAGKPPPPPNSPKGKKWGHKDRVQYGAHHLPGDVLLYDAEHIMDVGLNWVSYLFSIAYVLGVCSMVLIYLPGIGQSEGRLPSWDRLRMSFREGMVSNPTRPRDAATQPAGKRIGRSTNADALEPLQSRSADREENAREETAYVNENAYITCTMSISASESANIILRNTLGKILTNLQLQQDMGQRCRTDLDLWDIFIDEGHRIGAYYLYRAINLVFYECIPRTIALDIAKRWLVALNEPTKVACDTEIFDKVDPFELLKDAMKRKDDDQVPVCERSEILLLDFIYRMYKPLNNFSQPIDLLFDKLLDVPILNEDRFEKARRELPDSSLQRDPDEAMFGTSRRPSQHVIDRFKEEFGFSEAAAELVAGCVSDNPPARTLRDFLLGDFQREQAMNAGPADTFSYSYGNIRSEELKFFHPLVFQHAGALITGYKGETKRDPKGDRKVPSEVGSLYHTLRNLKDASSALLDSTQWVHLRPLFRPQLSEIEAAMSPKYYAFDHVVDVLLEFKRVIHESVRPEFKVHAMYAARCNPTKWKPTTKPGHRREVMKGVWVTNKPEIIKGPRFHPSDNADEAFRRRRDIANKFFESREEVGLMLEDGKSVNFYYKGKDKHEHMLEDLNDEQLENLIPVSTHLGKAGGLNYGMQVVVYEMFRQNRKPPSPTRPLIVGIIDARHTCNENFWRIVLPGFFKVPNDVSGAVFDRKVSFVQLPHAYVGMEHKNDKLDMRNDFLFTGMAVIRNQAYGMTSCGTGGIWSIVSDNLGSEEGMAELGNYFYGRTMIEDSASSIKEFLKGRKSIYFAPDGSKPAEQQVMCAVPKIGANYLEALERWDTGAVQCLWALGLGQWWFWKLMFLQLTLLASILAPAWVPLEEISDIFNGLANPSAHASFSGFFVVVTHLFINNPVTMVAVLAWIFWFSLLVYLFVLVLVSPAKLNNYLRHSILFFNVTYPLNTWTNLFWVALPPAICIMGKFPLQLQPMVAIFGSLALRGVEWLIVMSIKGDSEKNRTSLKEYSIFRSQQMNAVTVPLKIRAIIKGTTTGIKDIVLKEDNSFWISFGAAQAVIYVQCWLAFMCLAMFAAIVGGVVNLIIHGMTAVAPCTFGMVLAFIQLWLIIEPTIEVFKKRTVKISLRHTEVLVLLVVGLGIFALSTSVLSS